MFWHDSFSVLSHVHSSAVSEESSLSYCLRQQSVCSLPTVHTHCSTEPLQMQVLQKVHVVYQISTDVIIPALRLHVERGHSGTRTYVHNYIDRGQVEFNRRGLFTLARVNLYILMSHIPRVNCVLCLGGRIRCLHVVKEV